MHSLFENPKLKTVILDIDGTLLDSNDAHARAWVKALAEHGYVVEFEQVRPLIGMGGDKVTPILTGLDPESREAELIGESCAREFKKELPHLRPTPGTRALLEALTKRGLTLAIATSAGEEQVKALLEQAGIADLIHATASSGDADNSKPDPDIIQAALVQAKTQASHAIMIGDTPYDIEAATRARLPIIAVRCGGWWDDAALAPANLTADDPQALLDEGNGQ